MIPSNIPSWQPDDEVESCPICGRSFSMFYRRHHCRMCGRVVCSKCSKTRTTYLPTTYVVTPPSQPYLESPRVPHKTCDQCVAELELIRQALHPSDGPSGADTNSLSHELLVQSVTYCEEAMSRCPVCDLLLSTILNIEDQARHIDTCLREFTCSPGNAATRKRMIISKVPEKCGDLGECSVCFERMMPGDNVGRLECLCVFHEKCILLWFTRKGAGVCPVHN